MAKRTQKPGTLECLVLASSGGYAISGQGKVTLTLNVSPEARDHAIAFMGKMGRHIGLHMFVKAKVEDRVLTLGDFTLGNVTFSANGAAKVKLGSLDTYVETDNLSLLPLNSDTTPNFIVRFEAEDPEYRGSAE